VYLPQAGALSISNETRLAAAAAAAASSYKQRVLARFTSEKEF